MKKNKLVYEMADFSLDNDELLVNETLFHNANGYLGVRSNFEEGYPDHFQSIRGSYLNGFYDLAEMKQAEKLYGFVEEKQTIVNVADTQGIQLLINQERFSLFEGEVLKRSRTLDMEKGVTKRTILWRSPKGHEVEIVVTRMASFAMLPLFTIQYDVTAKNFSGELEFLSSHIGNVQNYFNPDDPRVAAESFRHIHVERMETKDEVSLITSRTSASQLQVVTAVKHRLSKMGEINHHIQGESIEWEVKTFIEENETVSLIKYTIFADSIREENPYEHAWQLMGEATTKSIETWYQRQEQFLTNYWDHASVEIDGDDELSMAMYYNLYQLLQSAGKDQYSNIAAKGLSGEGYEGHYFWDTEMYIQPFFLLTQPEMAKNLIQYRYNILDSAREHARIMCHTKGALYPWRTISGKECSGYYPSGSAQYHINGDIAYSVINYYLVTKDLDFIAKYGAEMIFETARLWLDAGHFYQDQFMIHDVTGPDEYTCVVNNNYYTNALAQYHLQWAVKFYQLLQANDQTAVLEKIQLLPQEIEEFSKAAEQMYLPYDSELDINPQDDSFLSKRVWDLEKTPKDQFPLLLHYHPLHLYRHQVCKQADTVLAHFIVEDAQSLRTIENSFHYYEKITTHDSSLSTCIFSIMAAKLKEYKKAYDYFGESAKLDLFNTHKNTKDGIHTANMGGNYMAIVYGFAGLRIKETGYHFSPFLPEKWTGYKFKLHYEDSVIRVKVDRQSCQFSLEKGSRKNIHVYGKSYQLEDSLDIPLEGK
ncbi:family 65 glycosyl hydrolase [Lederbergia sp. NSJ-179]|uniref:glycoside hydrolase family 65 protein n=1 Tax=Lederbergia sp. NSJ-179 TaxID=2931402 RepID=UPI001FD0B33E|nr:glycosyl hydrolase family 65 protein [Lederbergia sp. NSJ-179]MCJ7840046.1 family 65 glycosyl hydrolase [Lederbergia sp. NSJ-179]